MEKPSDLNINWNEIEESDFRPLTEGVYAGNVSKTEVKNSKSGTGKYLSLEITLLGAPGIKGRKIFDICMLSHPNPAAVTVGARKLKKLADVLDLDITEMESYSEFIGKPLGLKLGVESDAEYGDKNKVKGFTFFSEELLEPRSNGGF